MSRALPLSTDAMAIESLAWLCGRLLDLPTRPGTPARRPFAVHLSAKVTASEVEPLSWELLEAVLVSLVGRIRTLRLVEFFELPCARDAGGHERYATESESGISVRVSVIPQPVERRSAVRIDVMAAPNDTRRTS